METTDLTGAGTAPTTNRIELLSKSMKMVVDSAFGSQNMSEQEITQTLGELVKSKLLSADDSYSLRDRIMDQESFTRSIDRRVNTALKRKGFTPVSELQARLARMEGRVGNA